MAGSQMILENEVEFTEEQRQAFDELQGILEQEEAVYSSNMEMVFWKAFVAFQRYPFRTAKGLEFTYEVRGNEVFFSRKEKSITRATVDIALKRALSLGRIASGPKKLGCFGASYLYPVFMKLSVIRKTIPECT